MTALRGRRLKPWKRTCARLVSDCGNFTMEVREASNGRWHWTIFDASGKATRAGTRATEAGARAAAKRLTRRLSAALGKAFASHLGAI